MMYFFLNDRATSEIYTLSLHAALPTWGEDPSRHTWYVGALIAGLTKEKASDTRARADNNPADGKVTVAELHRSEEHTSELQSRQYLVCRLLLEKKTNVHCAPPALHTPN